MTDITKQTCSSCGCTPNRDLPTEPGHNDDVDLEFMLTVLKAAHDRPHNGRLIKISLCPFKQSRNAAMATFEFTSAT